MSSQQQQQQQQLSAQDWYNLLYEKQAPLNGDMIGKLLTRVSSDPDPLLRENLLLYLQDSALSLSEEPQIAEKVFEVLQAISTNPVELSSIRAQALCTQTSLSIELETLRMTVPQLETLVETLLDLLAASTGPTEQQDRALRSAACRCLTELEEAYPGLLCVSLPSLVEWMTAEKSYVLQDLVTLAAVVLLHGVSQLVSAPSTASAGTAELFGIQQQSQQKTDVVSTDTLQKEVLRAVGTLLNAIVDLSEWGVVRLVELLTPLASTGLLPASVLSPHCIHFVHTNSPLLMFIAADLAIEFPDVFGSILTDTISGLFSISDNTTLSSHWRVLSVIWTSLLIDQKRKLPTSRRPIPLLTNMALSLAPTTFNFFDLKEAKLCAMAWCFDNETLIPPPSVINLLCCLDEFRAYRPSDKPPRQFFYVIRQWLDAFPSLLEPLFTLLTQEIASQPEYLPIVLALIETVPKPLATQLLEHFSILLSSMPSIHLPRFLPIAKKIVADSSVSPTIVITAITNLLRKTTLCSSGLWSVGNDILSICREAMLNHPLTTIFSSIGELLSYLTDNFSDLDIKDRAAFYLQLITHVPGKRIRDILATRPPDVSPLSASPQTPDTPRRKITTATNVPAFLELKRLNPDVLFSGSPSLASSVDSSIWSDLDANNFPLVQSHFEKLQNNPISIQLPFILSYRSSWQPRTSPTTSPSISPQQQQPTTTSPPPPINTSYLDCSYCLTMELSQQQIVLYRPLQQVHVPYLKRGTTGSFPHVFSVSLKIEPVLPLPTRLVPTITFNDANGAVLSSILDAIDIQFEDLVLPLFSDSSSDGSISQIKLFNELWEYLGQQISKGINPITNEPIAVHVVKVVPGETSEIISTLKANSPAQPFFINISPEEAEKQERNTAIVAAHIAFLLPPRFHILACIEPHETGTSLIQIRTDFWRSLPFIDPLFSKLFH